jgi:hypothetical protein
MAASPIHHPTVMRAQVADRDDSAGRHRRCEKPARAHTLAEERRNHRRADHRDDEAGDCRTENGSQEDRLGDARESLVLSAYVDAGQDREYPSPPRRCDKKGSAERRLCHEQPTNRRLASSEQGDEERAPGEDQLRGRQAPDRCRNKRPDGGSRRVLGRRLIATGDLPHPPQGHEGR